MTTQESQQSRTTALSIDELVQQQKQDDDRTVPVRNIHHHSQIAHLPPNAVGAVSERTYSGNKAWLRKVTVVQPKPKAEPKAKKEEAV